MLFNTALVLSAVAASALAAPPKPTLPSLRVPSCPGKVTAKYDKSVPDRKKFPLTTVDLCYTPSELRLTFTAFEEQNFYFNATQSTNDPIWQYEVMEAFIAPGTADPTTYLELEVNPNNVTFQAFIYNPSKVSPTNTTFIQNPLADGLRATTVLRKNANIWISKLFVPLKLFNVKENKAKGSQWRMNFFRTVVSPKTFPKQGLGAWSTPDAPSFHKTPFFGHVQLV